MTASVKLSNTLYYGIYPTIVLPDYPVDHYIGLTEPNEMPYFECPEHATCISFPIKDRKGISVEKLKSIVDYINSLKGVIYIYCKGGHGRSGMIAAAVYGQRNGLTGKEALKHVNKEWKVQRDMDKIKPEIKKLGSPQTKSQKAVVIEFLDNSDVPKIIEGINIIFFYETKGKFGPLTNFYKLKKGLHIGDEYFIDTEQYFQVMKFRGPNATDRMIEYSNIIREADSPMKAKMLGSQKKNLRFGKKWKLNKKTDDRLVNDLIDEYRDVRYRLDWSIASIAVMLNGLYHKFTQYPELYDLLITIPDNTYFVEHTTRDKIWGDGGDGGTGLKGQNRLGKLITALSFCLKHKNCDKMIPKLNEMIKIKM